ncbi:UNVERIFIED_CONTAM: hypothetical protein GTU68_060096 [Idotea baltica]|nr:hypothetical protein [Idotea baltica]
MVVLSKNPVHSIFYLILVFCLSAGILVLFTIDFLAIIFIVVYVGAIAVLFLFVVMMLNIKLSQLSESLVRYTPLGVFVGLTLILEFNFFMKDSFFNTRSNLYLNFEWYSNLFGSELIALLGEIIYTDHLLVFIVSALILLLGMVGTISLTLHHGHGVRSQIAYEQIGKATTDSILFK